MSAHTPGRLAVTHNNWETSTVYCEGKEVARVHMDSEAHEDDEQHCENARRLVACWNACEGLSTESLGRLGTLDRARVEMDVFRAHLLAQRDELLELCGRALRALSEDDSPGLRDDLRAAITKIERGSV